MAVKYPFGYFSLPDRWIDSTLKQKSNKVVVISSFGNTAIEANGVKSMPLEQMLGRNIFNRNISEKDTDDPLTKIEGFFDEKNRIVYLHLKGIFDTSVYLKACKQFREAIKTQGFLVVWADWKFQYARALLLMFSVSHIILFHHPNHVFDVSYISLFKAMDAIRIQAVNEMDEIFKDMPDLSRDWLENGRMCSPRVLFLFSSSRIPRHILREAMEEKLNASKTDNARNHPLRKMELNLEYQIYRLLRNSRVITNICINSLFALPSNQPFVYICEDHQEPAIQSSLVKKNLRDMCNAKDPVVRSFRTIFNEERKSIVTLATKADSSLSMNKRQINVTPLSVPSEADVLSASLLSSISTDKKLNLEHSFSKFLRSHIDEAFAKGFEDNVGRNSGFVYFELPKLKTWLSVYQALHKFYIEESDEDNGVTGELRYSLNSDVRFSEFRCAKAMPLAIATYKNGLPAYYSQEEHESKVAMALSVLSANARGPMFSKYAADLQKTCEQYWMDGRIGCQTLSIMGNPCVQPMHRLHSDQDVEDSSLPFMEHDSSVFYAGYCNCGYTKLQLRDPFTDKAAFIDLYTHLRKQCCKDLDEIGFPSLNPVDAIECIEAPTFFMSSQDADAERNTDSDEQRSASACRDSPLLMAESSLESQGESKDVIRSSGNSTDEPTGSPTNSNSEIIPVAQDETSELIKHLKPSSHDVASAMLTINSPDDFIPKYTTWSLLCLGPSSLYSHNAGICNQPGFLAGTNFLLPWDVAVKIPDKNKWPAIAESMGKKGYLLKNKKNKVGADLTEFNVKVFLGCEYQCLRGHRFMMAGIDKYLKASSLGHVKDTAAKITSSDMPLYYPCPCSRNGTITNAQLMRLHVVTPKAPVNVTLSPVVQPSPSPDARFVPQPLSDGAIKLSSSTYWVLRLPFFYLDELEFYQPPDLDQQVDANYGKLLKNSFGISDINLER